jgi:soluble lytic murein transglycosylase
MLTKKRFYGWILAVWLVMGMAVADQRACFLQAEAALAKGNLPQYKKLKSQLKNYPLYPYLLYAEYDRNILAIPYGEFQAFTDTYADTPLAEQLRNRWLHIMAKQEEWQRFLKAYIPTEDMSLQCHFLSAEYNSRSDKKPVLEQILPLWLSGKEPPKSCMAPFQTFENSALLTRPLVWQRIKLAIEENNLKLARYLKRFLKKNEVAYVELWIMVHHNPYLVTQRKYFTANHAALLDILEHGVSQIAKDKPETAIQIWQKIAHQHSFQDRHWGTVVRSIGLAFAKKRHPLAEKWLSEVPDVYANQAVHESRMRLSIAKEDWHRVLQWAERLPDTLINHERWQYWQARALEKLHYSKESQAILAKLAQTRSYYGFLASQQLRKNYSIAQQKFSLDTQYLLAIAKKPSVLRARELFCLGREAKARSEWIYSTQRMTDKERHAAAALALRWNLPNWSILALSKAHNKDDLELRFPVVHSQPILKEAKRHQIDPALIFAVTRQESAFMPNARSTSGALGLMQLMPGTAQEVARKQRRALKGTAVLFDPATNIQLGTHYLRMLLDSYEDHPILATAAYNAGPGRIRQWLPDKTMPADAWVEGIPFKETRDYVQNVMTYTIIYQQLLGYKGLQSIPIPHIPGNKN